MKMKKMNIRLLMAGFCSMLLLSGCSSVFGTGTKDTGTVSGKTSGSTESASSSLDSRTPSPTETPVSVTSTPTPTASATPIPAVITPETLSGTASQADSSDASAGQAVSSADTFSAAESVPTVYSQGTSPDAAGEGNGAVAPIELNVHSTPHSGNDNIIGVLPAGQAIRVTGNIDGWFQFDFNGQTGYVDSDYFS